MSPKNTGLVFGAVLGGWHLVWSIIVLLGFGQLIVDFVFWMHMMQIPITVGPFSWAQSATLVVVTAIIGYIVGYVFALFWNRFHR